MDQRESERFYWRIETSQSKVKDVPQGAAILTVKQPTFSAFYLSNELRTTGKVVTIPRNAVRRAEE